MTRLKEIDITLKDPIELAVKSGGTGELTECDTVTLIAPAGKHRKYVSRIKNFCGYYMDKNLEKHLKRVRENPDKEKDAKEKKESDDDSKFDGPTLMSILTTTSIDKEDAMEIQFDLFQKLLEKGCGNIKNMEINSHLFDKFSYADLENLYGEYVVNFLLDSLVD